MMLVLFVLLSALWFAIDFKELKRRGAKYFVPYAVLTVLSYIVFFFAEYTDFNLAELLF